MSETKDMRPRLIRALAPLDAVPIENLVGKPGTPDVAFIGGWIECKWLRRWPERANTAVRLPHYTQEQRAWLLRHWNRGGWAGLMLQCGRQWLLFKAPQAQVIGVRRADLEALADWKTTNFNADSPRLVEYLRRCSLEHTSSYTSIASAAASASARRRDASR